MLQLVDPKNATQSQIELLENALRQVDRDLDTRSGTTFHSICILHLQNTWARMSGQASLIRSHCQRPR